MMTRPREEVGQRIAPARKNYRHSAHWKFTTEGLVGRVRNDGRVTGYEAGGEQWVARKVAVDQEPPARFFRQTIAPVWQRGRRIAHGFQLIEQSEGRRE